MEVTVHTDDLAKVLRLVQFLTERKSTVPILGTILLRADQKGFSISGTDLELGGICYCRATVKQAGSVAVPVHRLFEYVKMLPDGDLLLKEQAAGWLGLSCARSRSRIAGSAVDSYPELPKPPREGVSLSCGLLARLAEKVIFAISTEQGSPNLAGALLKLEKSGVTMVATDGHRLALAAATVDLPGVEEPIEVFVPKRALSAFLRFAEGRNDQPVRCTVTENHIFFVWQERLLLSRKLSGAFPDYPRVLPEQYSRSLSLDRGELRASIERVSRFAEERTRCMVVEVSPGQLALQAEDSNVGRSEEVLPVAYTDEPVRIGFNASYLTDFLSHSEHGQVRFLFKDGSSAAELQPEEGSGNFDYRYVVMPMRVPSSAV
ncbi:MAG: DNA polymerase III subunit beta [Bryobacteraceae bacterium]